MRPHVVLLGAGASCAAIPNGDKNGKKISAMRGFLERLGLVDIIRDVGLHTYSDNLEDIYMEIDERSMHESTCMDAKIKLEKSIRDYMLDYVIPDCPTVYDFLVMGLTIKDLIATFNWDPLLVQAYVRCSMYTQNWPKLVFLHGNVAVGYCEKDSAIGYPNTPCRCGEPFKQSKLLFPIKNKDYTSNMMIKKSWEILSEFIEAAYMITIFGYSAPKSDVAAIAMLKKAWGNVEDRKLEEIEIIDIREEGEVYESWSDFIFSHHYSYHTDFFTTTIGRFPRRSCEATFKRFMENCWIDGSKGFKPSMDFNDIYRLIEDLLEEESEKI